MNIWERVRENLLSGWCKGTRRNEDGEVCLLGAFADKSGMAEDYPKELGWLADCIQESDEFGSRLHDRDPFNGGIPSEKAKSHRYHDGACIAGFNNHGATTLTDVLAVVDCAEAKSQA